MVDGKERRRGRHAGCGFPGVVRPHVRSFAGLAQRRLSRQNRDRQRRRSVASSCPEATRLCLSLAVGHRVFIGFQICRKKRDIAVRFCVTRPPRQEIDGTTIPSRVSGSAQLAAKFGRLARASAALSRAAGFDADVGGKMHISELRLPARLTSSIE